MTKFKSNKNNNQFKDSLLINDMTFIDYLERFKQVALSMFEWLNLPSSMNEEFLEKTLYYDGMASLLETKEYGKINTRCSTNAYINIYEVPTKLKCYSLDFSTDRILYTRIK